MRLHHRSAGYENMTHQLSEPCVTIAECEDLADCLRKYREDYTIKKVGKKYVLFTGYVRAVKPSKVLSADKVEDK